MCLDRSCNFDNCVLCSCCGNMICGFCIIQIFLYSDKKLECPLCRTSYNLPDEIIISNLEKTKQRQIEHKQDIEICLALYYYKLKRYRESRKLLENFGSKLIEFKGGYYYLAMMYCLGLGGKKNSRKAFNMFLKIADVGVSLRMLGEMFMAGEGTIKNKEYGLILIKISRENGNIHYRTGKNMIL